MVPALLAYAVGEFGHEFFSQAWDEFFLWESVPEEIADIREFGTTFDPFFVFSFVPDAADEELPGGRPTELVALHFLREEVESCPIFTASSSGRPVRATRASSWSNRRSPAGRFHLEGHSDRPSLSRARAERIAHPARRRPDVHPRRYGWRRDHHDWRFAVGHPARVASARYRVPRTAPTTSSADT